jgi:hypothetical protein
MDKNDCVNIFISEGAGVEASSPKCRPRARKCRATPSATSSSMRSTRASGSASSSPMIGAEKTLVQKSGYFARAAAANATTCASSRAAPTSPSNAPAPRERRHRPRRGPEQRAARHRVPERIKGGKPFDIDARPGSADLLKDIGQPKGSTVKTVAGAAWEPMKTAGDAIGKGTVKVGQTLRDEVLRLHDFFDVTLPGIAARHHLIFDFEPKVGDLLRREYVRYPLEVRYGLSKNWEIFGGVTPVSPNPIDEGEDHRWSMGMAKLGVRYALPKAERLGFQKISLGFEGRQPLGNPPLGLIDHYLHLRPSITASRPVTWFEDTTFFLGLTYDRSVWAPGHDDVSSEAVKRHMSEIAPGLLYKPGEFGYFAQYALRHWDEPVGYRLEHIGKVGVIWDMPLERSRKWRLPGKWQFELGVRASDLDGEGTDLGVHARAKVRADWFRRKK